MTRRLLVFLAVLPIVFVLGEQANQLDFAACPVRHNPEFYCCKYSETTMEIYTKFNRPTGGAYDSFYRKGWNEGRRVNYPYHKFTPNSPTYYYDNPSSVCRVQAKVTDFSTGTMTYEIQCASSNTTLQSDSENPMVFWTSPSNSRNNNASFPVGAQCSSLMTVDGSVNTTAKALCASVSTIVTPQFTTYWEEKLLLVYLLYVAVFGLIGLWMVYKSVLQARNKSVNEMSRKLLNSPATPLKSVAGLTESRNSHVRDSDLRIQREASDTVLQTGFKVSKVGYAVFTYFLAATIALNALITIVICDYYGKFTPTLFGSDNALVFFLVWLFSAVWFATIVTFRGEILSFFRLRVDLNEAQYVHLFKRDDTEVLLADRSGVSALVQHAEAIFSRKNRLSGYQETVTVQETGSLRFLTFQHLRYVYDDNEKRFVPGVVALGETHREILRGADGISTVEAERRLQTVGPNTVDVTLPSMGLSLIQEFFTLFYIYQIMCYYVWYYFTYWNLGIVMTVVVLGTAVINIYTKQKMQGAIVKMTRYRTQVSVFRDNDWKILESPEIVPGDLVKVPENWVIPCDMVIVQGTTVCDESTLTGESMPVQKFPIPDHSNTIYNPEGRDKKYTLFSGTRVLSSGRNEAIHAIVQTTGAHTTKGQLIQSILFPVPMRFKYDEHLKALIALLLVYSIIGCYLGINFLTSNGKLTNKMTAFCYCIFLISAVVSPLLPVVTTVGQVNAATRLEKSGIFSLNVKRITLCGKIRVFCFDKTGTLTKQGLDYLGVLPVASKVFLTVEKENSNLLSQEMQFALATCHSVGSLDGKLVGNEVEVRMFEATGWDLILQEGSKPFVKSADGEELEFVKRFDFDHHRMSMSVVVRHRSSGKLFVFCKGSYERMQHLSRPDTIPSNYKSVADQLAKDGCYVLGISYRELPSNWTIAQIDAFLGNRDAIDADLSLLGLILFRNELKEDTSEAISQLKAGDIRVVMITGDNAMCGCFIARSSGMVSSHSKVVLGEMVRSNDQINTLIWREIDDETTYDLPELKRQLADGEDLELAVTGAAFEYLTTVGEMDNLLLSVRIFSRMTPDNKVECVKMHMEAGAVTGMCGDGGNDCGALRIAHAGIALSDAEASVVSPFTSKSKTIKSVVDICREGRCSVATSFASVKFLIMYGVIASTLRLFQWYHAVIMSEWCFILADGVTLVGLSYVITLSKPLEVLNQQRPTSSLIGPTTLTSIVGQELINVVFLFSGVDLLVNQVWYCPFSPDNVDLAKWWLFSDNHMATILFFTIITQQQLAAWVFSFGSRYRAPIWRNYLLVLVFILLTGLDIYLILGEPSVVMDLFRIASATNVVVLPDIPLSFSFRAKYFALLVGNVATVILFEYLVVLGPVRNFLRKKYHKDYLHMKKPLSQEYITFNLNARRSRLPAPTDKENASMRLSSRNNEDRPPTPVSLERRALSSSCNNLPSRKHLVIDTVTRPSSAFERREEKPRGILKKTQSPVAILGRKRSPDEWFQHVMTVKMLSPIDLCDIFSYGDARKHPLVPLSHVCEVLFDLDPEAGNGVDPFTEEMEEFLYQFATESYGEILINIREALRALDIWQSRSKPASDPQSKAKILESKNKKLQQVISSLQDANLRLSRQLDSAGLTRSTEDSTSAASLSSRRENLSTGQVSPVRNETKHSQTFPPSPRRKKVMSSTKLSVVNLHEQELVEMASQLQFTGVKRLEELLIQGDADSTGFVNLKQLCWILADQFALKVSEVRLIEVCMGMNFNAGAQLDYKEFLNVLMDILIYALPNVRESAKRNCLLRLDEYFQGGFPPGRGKTYRLLASLCSKFDLEGDQMIRIADLIRVFHVELEKHHALEQPFPLEEHETIQLAQPFIQREDREEESLNYTEFLDALLGPSSQDFTSKDQCKRAFQWDFWRSIYMSLCGGDSRKELKVQTQLGKIMAKVDLEGTFTISTRHFARVFECHLSPEEMEILSAVLEVSDRDLRYDVLLNLVFGTPPLHDDIFLNCIRKKLLCEQKRLEHYLTTEKSSHKLQLQDFHDVFIAQAQEQPLKNVEMLFLFASVNLRHGEAIEVKELVEFLSMRCWKEKKSHNGEKYPVTKAENVYNDVDEIKKLVVESCSEYDLLGKLTTLSRNTQGWISQEILLKQVDKMLQKTGNPVQHEDLKSFVQDIFKTTNSRRDTIHCNAFFDALIDWEAVANNLKLPHSLVEVKKVLEKFDWEHTGVIPCEDWNKAYRLLSVDGQAMTEWEVKVLQQRFPGPIRQHERFNIDYDHFILFLLEFQQHQARKSFQVRVVKLLQQRLPSTVSTAQMERVFRALDTDKKGHFNAADLKSYLTKEFALENEEPATIELLNSEDVLASVMQFLAGNKDRSSASSDNPPVTVSFQQFREIASSFNSKTHKTSSLQVHPSGPKSDVSDSQTVSSLRALETAILDITGEFSDLKGNILPSRAFRYFSFGPSDVSPSRPRQRSTSNSPTRRTNRSKTQRDLAACDLDPLTPTQLKRLLVNYHNMEVSTHLISQFFLHIGSPSKHFLDLLHFAQWVAPLSVELQVKVRGVVRQMIVKGKAGGGKLDLDRFIAQLQRRLQDSPQYMANRGGQEDLPLQYVSMPLLLSKLHQLDIPLHKQEILTLLRHFGMGGNLDNVDYALFLQRLYELNTSIN